MERRDQDPENYYLTMALCLLIGMLSMFLLLGCAGPEIARERPSVKIYTILGGGLWRKQDFQNQILGMALAEGFQCMSASDLEKLLAACFAEAPTVSAR